MRRDMLSEWSLTHSIFNIVELSVNRWENWDWMTRCPIFLFVMPMTMSYISGMSHMLKWYLMSMSWILSSIVCVSHPLNMFPRFCVKCKMCLFFSRSPIALYILTIVSFLVSNWNVISLFLPYLVWKALALLVHILVHLNIQWSSFFLSFPFFSCFDCPSYLGNLVHHPLRPGKCGVRIMFLSNPFGFGRINCGRSTILVLMKFLAIFVGYYLLCGASLYLTQ